MAVQAHCAGTAGAPRSVEARLGAGKRQARSDLRDLSVAGGRSAIGGELVDGAACRLRQHHPRHDVDLRWEGKIARDSEAVMVIKTRRSLAEAAIAAARQRHPYTNPAFLVIPVEGGSADYLGWLMQETATE